MLRFGFITCVKLGLSCMETIYQCGGRLEFAGTLLDEQARSKSGRILLAVDDLQRVDGPSRNAFADVLSEPPRLPALFLAAHTPGFDAGWGTQASARLLPGLPPPAVSRLLRSSRGRRRGSMPRRRSLRRCR